MFIQITPLQGWFLFGYFFRWATPIAIRLRPCGADLFHFFFPPMGYTHRCQITPFQGLYITHLIAPDSPEGVKSVNTGGSPVHEQPQAISPEGA
jgi:hypothetical protein